MLPEGLWPSVVDLWGAPIKLLADAGGGLDCLVLAGAAIVSLPRDSVMHDHVALADPLGVLLWE